MKDLKNLNCLLPKTRKLLLVIIQKCNFLDKYVLVGGSALSMHLCHRKSEDLDFFTYEDSFEQKEILNFLNYFSSKEILNQTNEQIDLLLEGVKVTFFNAKWIFLKPQKIQKFNLSPIELICAMKVNVLFLRAKFRDYYDLYFMAKEIELDKIFENSKQVIDGLTFKLFVASLLYVDDIEDDNIKHLEPIEKLNKFQIRDFFQKKIIKLKINNG